jgi:hypothetical protein
LFLCQRQLLLQDAFSPLDKAPVHKLSLDLQRFRDEPRVFECDRRLARHHIRKSEWGIRAMPNAIPG